jgi:hypothetical protein
MVLEFVYPALVLGMMRSFTEHRWGERASERTAIVESNWVFGLLFLWNNLHAVHHARVSGESVQRPFEHWVCRDQRSIGTCALFQNSMLRSA